MFNKIALIAALRHELKPLSIIGDWREEDFRGRWLLRRELAGVELIATTCGLGKVMAAATTQMLIDLFEVDLVINFGSCGGLAPELAIGDLVLASRVIEYDFLSEYKKSPVTNCAPELVDSLQASFPEWRVGPLASADRNADTPAVRTGLFERYQALAADWEGASIVRVAKRMGVPALVLRGVTDIGADELNAEYENNHQSVLASLGPAVMNLVTAIVN